MKIRLPVLPALALLCSCAHADCTYPQAPEQVPNGYIATQADMSKAADAFKAFNAAITAYTACVDKEAAMKIAKGGKDLTPEQIAQINDEATHKHDAAVDDLETRVAQFNTEIRAFNVLHK